ncbi:MAG: hypothetical protein JSS96_05915 [Bacteroidetes bacterium]|nr:hypothetical protein [Bacteroidota bacterium]
MQKLNSRRSKKKMFPAEIDSSQEKGIMRLPKFLVFSGFFRQQKLQYDCLWRIAGEISG